jgi:hypothetical protein
MLNSSFTTPIAARGAITSTLPKAAPMASKESDDIDESLGAMAKVATSATSHGMPANADDATAVLNTGADYVRNGQRTI